MENITVPVEITGGRAGAAPVRSGAQPGLPAQQAQQVRRAL